MIVNKSNIPLYGIIIVLSIIIGVFYIYYNLRKEGITNKQVLLYFIMYVTFAFVFGKMYTMLAYGINDAITAGLSAYGGLIGVVFASIVFEKILPVDGKIIKYTILSLPLVYGLTKIACSVMGCCGGLPYEGLLKVKYPFVLNIWQFPVQIIETISCLTIFFICQLFHKNKNINYIVLIAVSLTKFSLDFLRYDHIETLITKNQIFSIILILITIILYIRNKFIETRNN